jgi:dTDP-4-amino-4,6-dideoxygalactose transaminase
MFIPVAPLPSPRIVLKSAKCLRTTLLNLPWHIRAHNRLTAFPRGAYALASLAKTVAKNAICFMPSYYCNESLGPLRQMGIEIVFYRVRESMCPDWDDVFSRAGEKKPDIFVLVHYFGMINDVSSAITFAEKNDCILLEDAAHVLMPHSGMAKKNSIHLYSPHKLLAIPPIGLLSFPGSTPVGALESYRVGLKREDFIWMIKRFIQLLVVYLSANAVWKTIISWYITRQRLKKQSFSNNGKVSNTRVWTSLVGLLGLHGFAKELDEIASMRLANYAYLVELLRETDGDQNILPYPEWPKGQVPYLFPLRISSTKIDYVMNALQRRNIPAHQWPDLPPEVTENGDIYQTALELRNGFLFLPIHQTLTNKHLNYMACCLMQALKGEI